MQTTTDQLEELVRALVAARIGADPKNPRLRQIDVARELKIGQPAISEFERGVATPRVETIQKYARAVGAQVAFVITAPDSEENGQPE